MDGRKRYGYGERVQEEIAGIRGLLRGGIETECCRNVLGPMRETLVRTSSKRRYGA